MESLLPHRKAGGGGGRIYLSYFQVVEKIWEKLSPSNACSAEDFGVTEFSAVQFIFFFGERGSLFSRPCFVCCFDKEQASSFLGLPNMDYFPLQA